MNITKKLIVAGGFIALTGCSTMMSGTTQSIKIDSFPSEAKVFTAVQDKEGVISKRIQVGITPTTVALSRKDGIILVEKEGYEEFQVPLKRTMNPWMLGDVVLTSLLSTSIDTSTGASNEYDPGEYSIELIKK